MAYMRDLQNGIEKQSERNNHLVPNITRLHMFLLPFFFHYTKCVFVCLISRPHLSSEKRTTFFPNFFHHFPSLGLLCSSTPLSPNLLSFSRRPTSMNIRSNTVVIILEMLVGIFLWSMLEKK